MKWNLGWLLGDVQGKLAGSKHRRDKLTGSIVQAELVAHVPQNIPYDKDRCPCAAWALADATWVAMTPEERAAWNDAVRVGGMSGYDLWMSWAVSCWTLGFDAPGQPPTSGGHAVDIAHCHGGPSPPPECVKPPYLPPGENCPPCPALTPLHIDLTCIDFPEHLDHWNRVFFLNQVDEEPCSFVYEGAEVIVEFGLRAGPPLHYGVLITGEDDEGEEAYWGGFSNEVQDCYETALLFLHDSWNCEPPPDDVIASPY